MTKPDQARIRMQEADPVPSLHAISDELVASVRMRIDAEITGTESMPVAEPVSTGYGFRGRRVLAVAAAFVATIVIIGGIGLLRSEDPTVGEVATTVPTTVTTVPPQTTLPATTLPAATPPAESSTTTTVPPKPDSLEISWERVPEQAALEDGWIAAVTLGGPGYVAVGGTVGCSDPSSPNCRRDAAAWVSADGLAWERVVSPSFRGEETRWVANGDPLDGDQYMNDVAWSPSGFVAVGNAPVIDPERSVGYLERPGIWVSADGREWNLLPHDEELFAGIEGLWRVVTFEDRFVAFGDSSAWLSEDGINWQRVEIDTDSGVGDVTVWNDMLVAVGGTYDGHPAAWMSSDGVTWTRVSGPEMAEAAGNLQGVGGNADGVVAIGTSIPTGGVTAWRSEDGSDWSVAPEWLGGYQEANWTSRTALSVDQGTGGIDDDVILINGGGTALLWGTADGGEHWYVAGQFDGGPLESLASGAPAVFNTVNEVLVAGDRLLAFGKVVAWSGTEQIGGLCYVDPGDGSLGSCRADATIWVGTWGNP